MAWTCNGFSFGSVSAGIKASGAKDLGVLASDRPATAAAVFTQNRLKAAPVRISSAALKKSGGVAQVAVVNSGNANACTGDQGTKDARRMVAAVAKPLGVDKKHVIVSSTGVIGVPLPMDKVNAGIDDAVARLSKNGFAGFADAILTTDKRAKKAQREVIIGGKKLTLLGCTKGAGMIAPNMATTLTFVVSDARIAPAVLRQALVDATECTFNAMTVDGDTSTNDMILAMANGAAGGPSLRGKAARQYAEALTELLHELAHALMRDGEGVHHVVTIRVRGARSVNAARKVAREIANSSLVKTAIAGCDPNWGRILAAAGNAGVAMSPAKLSLRLDNVVIAEAGVGLGGAKLEKRAAAVMRKPSYEVVLDLNAGSAEAAFLACDLSHEYVTINADYRT